MDSADLMHVNWDSIDDASSAIYRWANETFPGRVPAASLSKLVLEEIPEMLMHLKEKGKAGIEGELADCFILLLDLAMIWHVDVGQALLDKMTLNAGRTWTYDRTTKFFNHVKDNHDEITGSGETTPGVRHHAMDDSAGISDANCRGAPVSGVGSGDILVRLLDGWHTTQLIRKGSGWVLGPCARCGRDLDRGFAVPDQVSHRRNLAGDLEETEGTGVG